MEGLLDKNRKKNDLEDLELKITSGLGPKYYTIVKSEDICIEIPKPLPISLPSYDFGIPHPILDNTQQELKSERQKRNVKIAEEIQNMKNIVQVIPKGPRSVALEASGKNGERVLREILGRAGIPMKKENLIGKTQPTAIYVSRGSKTISKSRMKGVRRCQELVMTKIPSGPIIIKEEEDEKRTSTNGFFVDLGSTNQSCESSLSDPIPDVSNMIEFPNHNDSLSISSFSRGNDTYSLRCPSFIEHPKKMLILEEDDENQALVTPISQISQSHIRGVGTSLSESSRRSCRSEASIMNDALRKRFMNAYKKWRQNFSRPVRWEEFKKLADDERSEIWPKWKEIRRGRPRTKGEDHKETISKESLENEPPKTLRIELKDKEVSEVSDDKEAEEDSKLDEKEPPSYGEMYMRLQKEEMKNLVLENENKRLTERVNELETLNENSVKLRDAIMARLKTDILDILNNPSAVEMEQVKLNVMKIISEY
eukprot:TRINITY_DN10401_c0_g1_i1.p1 TRINITY_DN10401_c0_g1~~TRINITY_DN10401_c0_g1_i1.p1  ORF type:complete len:482 (+),score=69.33 TRINITY_DN10401_c0_g1_i1:45-1490(+)